MSTRIKISSPSDLAPYIDHTILKPDTRREDARRFCHEAIEYGFASVCVNPWLVATVAEALRDSTVDVCSVIGFPLGAMVSETKVAETRRAVQDGATEIDMVINVGALREGDEDLVRQEITAIKHACGPALLKVIIETCLLTDKEKVTACRLSQEAGADFVKTSTGFAHGGATVQDVALMRKTVGDAMGVKASGGIRTFADAVSMIEAGANRIGASASISIISG